MVYFLTKTICLFSLLSILSLIFSVIQAHLVRAAEVKKSIEWIMSNLDGHYAAESVAAAIAHGAAASEAAQDDHNQNQVNSYAVAYSSQRNTIKVPYVQGKANELTSPSNVSKNFRSATSLFSFTKYDVMALILMLDVMDVDHNFMN